VADIEAYPRALRRQCSAYRETHKTGAFRRAEVISRMGGAAGNTCIGFSCAISVFRGTNLLMAAVPSAVTLNSPARRGPFRRLAPSAGRAAGAGGAAGAFR